VTNVMKYIMEGRLVVDAYSNGSLTGLPMRDGEKWIPGVTVFNGFIGVFPRLAYVGPVSFINAAVFRQRGACVASVVLHEGFHGVYGRELSTHVGATPTTSSTRDYVY